MLVLRQRVVLASVVAVVALALLLTLLAPGVLPATALTGFLVAVLALAVGLAGAFAANRGDPVLRAPGQARLDGSSVLGWPGSLTDERDLTAVVTLLRGRIDAKGRHRLLLVEGGGGARNAAVAIGSAAADAGTSVLLVDLTDDRSADGIAAVGDGSLSLGDAAEIEPERNFARIGAGRRLGDAVAATVAVLERPRTDLELLLVVAPAEMDLRRPLLDVVDRAALVVTAGSRRRAAVRTSVSDLEDSAAAADILLVGSHLTDLAPVGPRPTPASPGDAVGQDADAAGLAPVATDGPDSEPGRPTDAPPVTPAVSSGEGAAAPSGPPPATTAHRTTPAPAAAPPAVGPTPSTAVGEPEGIRRAGASTAPDGADTVAGSSWCDPGPSDSTPTTTSTPRSSALGDAPPTAPPSAATPAAPSPPVAPPDSILPVGRSTSSADDAGMRADVGAGAAPDADDTVVTLEDPAAPSQRLVTEIDGSWQFRPFRAEDAEDGAHAVAEEDVDATAEVETIALDDEEDLVTTATLEFLARGERDEH